MEQLFIPILVGLTSLAAYAIGRRGLGLSRNNFRLAISGMLGSVGMTLVFFAVNLGMGMTIILLGRFLLREFVSLYLINDVALLILSLLQGLTFQWWRQA